MPDAWWYVSLPHATFAVECLAGRVVRAAPIAAWCVGREVAGVLAYWRGRGARVEALATVAEFPPAG